MPEDKKFMIMKLVSFGISIAAALVAMKLSDMEQLKMKDEITKDVMDKITQVLAENNEEVL